MMPAWMLLANLSDEDREWVLDQLDELDVDLEQIVEDMP